MDRAYVARLWHRLMQGLGYERYGACGGDFGAGVATYMASDRALSHDRHPPEHAGGESLPGPGLGAALALPSTPTLTTSARWDETERGYSAIQSTRPQTLGYGLTDSPVGLAAWLVEKWRAWSDSGGDLDAHIGRDSLLTTITLYWVTGSITSSMRDYFDNRWHTTADRPRRPGRDAHRDGGLRERVRAGGRAASRAVRAPLRHPSVDRVPAWRALRRDRRAGPARIRHPSALRGP